MTQRDVSLAVPDAEGGRLDLFLTERLSGNSRSALRRWIREGRVSVDGRRASKPGQELRPGMQISVSLPVAPADGPRPESIPLELVHDDPHLAVVVKPAGMIVHRGHGQSSGTLVNALLGLGVPLAPAGSVQRPGIVHRLDQGTSGLIVVAKDDSTYHALTRALARREIRKTYRALVWGKPEPDSGRIERAIGRSRGNPIKMAVQGTRGRVRPAVTVFRTLEQLPGFALLEIDLQTGRTHQIRVHLQSIHHAVVGDERYGGRAWRGVQQPIKRRALREFPRLALHASRLAFVHPVSGREVAFDAPLPPDFRELLDVLRDDR